MAGAGRYVETDLASDIQGRAQNLDASLVNPWGLVRGPSTPWWAVGSNASGTFRFATNFRAATIDVFGSNFQHATLAGSFSDPGIPTGFAPFGIANLAGQLYVTYARQDAALHDDVAGPAKGFVDV